MVVSGRRKTVSSLLAAFAFNAASSFAVALGRDTLQIAFSLASA